MGKSRRGAKEFTREQKLTKENRQLKQEVAQLRKQLARLDLDRYDTVREMVEEHRAQESLPEFGTDFLENLKKTWLCDDCRNGYLEIILYTRLDSTYYYRCCNNCTNRTKGQKYTPEVKGIIKKVDADDRN